MREDIPHHTPEQVRGYLIAARELVDALEVPADLREVAFGKAVDMLAAKQLILQPAQPPGLALPFTPQGRH